MINEKLLFSSVIMKTVFVAPKEVTANNHLQDDIFDKLKNLLKLKSENDIELHVQEVRKRGKKIEMNSKELSLSEFGGSKKEKLDESKKAKYHDLEDMVNRMQLSYDEIMDVLDIKFFLSKKQDILYQLAYMKLVTLIRC